MKKMRKRPNTRVFKGLSENLKPKVNYRTPVREAKVKGKIKVIESKAEKKALALHTPAHNDIRHLNKNQQSEIIKKRDRNKTIDTALKLGIPILGGTNTAGQATSAADDILSQTGIPDTKTNPQSNGGINA